MSERNPAWTRDELILTLEFYLQYRPSFPDKQSTAIQALSNELGALAQRLGLTGSQTLRNINGVYMKLMNFRRFDPTYIAEGKKGLERGGKLEGIIWSEFAGEPEKLAEAANSIRAHSVSDNAPTLEAIDTDFIIEAKEGKLLTRTHVARERNRQIVQKKKKSFSDENGSVYCEACGFNFESTYGERGKDFIECHHVHPVSKLKPGQVTRLDDLVLLCSNCHRMVHSKSPWLTIKELKALLRISLIILALSLPSFATPTFAASDGDTKDTPEQPTVLPEPPEQDLRVIDGDTLKIAGTTYRMWGIDAPEKGQQCERNEGEYYDCGAHSTLALKTIIGKNEVSCEKVNTDRYKRVVARCYLGGTMDLGSWMVNAGYAVEYKRYSKGYYQTEQDNAEEAQRGLWAGDFTMPWDYRKERR